MTKSNMIPIEITAASIEHLGSDFYYIKHVFNALREHKELLEQPDYKRLYDESLDFLFRHAVVFSGWKKEKREWGFHCLECLADIHNKYDDDSEKYSVETVDFFLAQRRKIWNS